MQEVVLTRRAVMASLAASAVAAPRVALAEGAQKTLRVGAPLPLTGPLAPEGIKQQQGYDLWAETANRGGGIKAGGTTYRVEIVYVDYQSNTPRAVQTAERLITDDKVDFLFAPFGSGAAKAASGVSEKYGVPTIAASASSEQVYDQGYKFLFGTFTPNQTLTEPLSDIVKAKKPDVKAVAILARNDLFPLAIGQEMEKSAKARGFAIPYFEKYAIGTMDFGSALTQMRGARPDWVFATGYINDLVAIRKQMGELGIKAPVVTMIAGPAYQEFIDAAGPLAENVSSAAWWHPAVRYEGKDVFGSTQSFNAAFKQKYGSVPDYAQASASAAGAILQLAIEQAGSIDRKAVRDALSAMDVTTFFGRVKFGTNGQITSLQPPVFQIQDGKPVVIHPAEIAQSEMRFNVI